MWFPRSVKIGGRNVKVSLCRGKLGDMNGAWYPSEYTIRIDLMEDHITLLSDEALFTIFIHECMHAIDATYCDYQIFKGPKHGNESDYITPFVEGLIQFLRENWRSLEKMKKLLDG